MDEKPNLSDSFVKVIAEPIDSEIGKFKEKRPLTTKEKRIIETYLTTKSMNQTAKMIGVGRRTVAELLQTEKAEKYIKEYENDPSRAGNQSRLIKAIITADEINPLKKHLDKLDNSIDLIVSDFTILSKKKESLSKDEQERFDRLARAIPVLDKHRERVSSDPIKLLQMASKVDKKARDLSLAAAKKSGLIKELNTNKNTDALFGKG